VLDFGSQYTHLLARRIRELGVFSEIMLPTASTNELMDCKGIILSGGPKSVDESNAVEFNKMIFSIGKPVLGLCYGHQLMAFSLNGKVEHGTKKEYGKAKLQLKEKSMIFSGVINNSVVWMSHGDKVTVVPNGFKVTASTNDCEIAGMSNEEKKLFGFQFHPEVTHSVHGMKMLENFVFDVCKAEKNWDMKNFLEEELKKIKEKVENKKVFLLASGGVDSTVCAALLGKAIPKNHLYCLHVDSGLMRKNESIKVKNALNEQGIELNVLNAEKDFLNALNEVDEPEQKRIIIGEKFVELAEKELERIAGKEKNNWIIAQGTIYPDTIESGGTKNADKIKTHHNRVELMQELISKGRVIEPLNELYKDEVRELGLMLGLPKELVFRHPFPGPGLAIRILCGKKIQVEKKEELELRLNEFIKGFNFTAKVLPLKAVGVQGDNRTYRYACLLEGLIEFEKLELISTDLTNAFSEINRIVFAVHPNKINSVEFISESHLTEKRINLLRKADAVVNEFIKEKELYNEIWQFPVVLAPLKINNEEGETIILRPVTSREAMTARFAWIEKKLLIELAQKLIQINGINAVLYDCTNKPPATIEWE
ncbi:MAG: glutamine-hydrolyzing GMP synthase, partial [Candidatus Diapherotrites archaeon]|nr:glutamine-hydrolyzing GMP synthase [Candidatus Diapherotrites archaeon]